MFVSIGAGMYSLYLYSRKLGWGHFLVKEINVFLHDVSIFDILVDIIVYRRFMTTVISVITPFLQTNNEDDARNLLRSEMTISPNLKKIIFRKVNTF